MALSLADECRFGLTDPIEIYARQHGTSPELARAELWSNADALAQILQLIKQDGDPASD